MDKGKIKVELVYKESKKSNKKPDEEERSYTGYVSVHQRAAFQILELNLRWDALHL